MNARGYKLTPWTDEQVAALLKTDEKVAALLKSENNTRGEDDDDEAAEIEEPPSAQKRKDRDSDVENPEESSDSLKSDTIPSFNTLDKRRTRRKTASKNAPLTYQPQPDEAFRCILREIWTAADAAAAEAALGQLLQWLNYSSADASDKQLVVRAHVDSLLVDECIRKFPHSTRLFDLGCLILAHLVPLFTPYTSEAFRRWGGMEMLVKSIAQGTDEAVVLSSLQMVDHMQEYFDAYIHLLPKGIVECMEKHSDNVLILLAAANLLRTMLGVSKRMNEAIVHAGGLLALSKALTLYCRRAEIRATCGTVHTMLLEAMEIGRQEETVL